jgi:broad specificity phosphatase PhoE
VPTVYLVRHGQASFGAERYDVLSDVGRRQAAAVGAEVARRAPRDPVVACGTLQRQRDSAALLMGAAGIGGEPSVDPRWNEYDHLDLIRRYAGQDAAGRDSRAVQTMLDRALDGWITGDPGDWAAFAGGAMAALGELAAALGRGRDAIVVTSGGVVAAICGALLSAPPAGVVALNRVAVNGAITTLVVGRNGTSLLAFNDHAHFAGDGRALLTYR